MGSTTDSFEEFAVAGTPRLFRTAWLLSGDWHLAEDLVQETLARMYRSWRGVRRIDDPAAYAQTVLARTFISHRRRRRSSEQPTDVLPEQPAADGDSVLRLVLRDALAQLAPLDRAVLVLRYFEDRSVEQVASDLGCSGGAVRTRTSRALARMRNVLDDDPVRLFAS